jgi:hypothetical protein
MKSITMPGQVQLDEKTKKQLTSEVKETLAQDNCEQSKRVFTATDMWYRHRSYRNAGYLMRRSTLN